jgi:FkbM family methyltransferase
VAITANKNHLIRQAIKALLPAHAKRFARSVLEKLNLVEPQHFETPESILVKAYKRIGILNYENEEVSGDAFLLSKILPALVTKPRPVVFDVGANAGDYTNALLNSLSKAKIHAFEPSSETYAVLTNRVRHEDGICVMKGMSGQSGKAEFFDYPDSASQHASLHREVLSELHHANRVRKFEAELTTLDEYCAEQNLRSIEFIKIDTEGHELAVLQGGKQMIETGGLPIIQFEFNEMNVISKSSLRDFYKLLESYDFYRLMPAGLLRLGAYSSRNEIYAFQNILAVRADSYSPEIIAPFVVSALSKPPAVKPRL